MQINVSDMDKIVERIKEVCNEEASKLVESESVYAAFVEIYLDGDTYYMSFTVDGTSGVVTYKTPVLKVGDDKYIRGREKEIIDEYREYCSNILDAMSRLASEEY